MSNNIAANKLKANPTSAFTGFPFTDEKCYSTFVRGDFAKEPIDDGLAADGT